MNTEYTINQILKEVAANAVTSDYTDREINDRGDKVTCYCAVSSQVFDTLYPRYEVSWKTSKEEGYIQGAFHFRAPELHTSYMRIAKIYPDDNQQVVSDKIHNAFVSGLKRGKELYDGDNLGPWHNDYQE